MSEPFVIEQKQADNSYKQLIPLAYINRNEFHNSNFKINQRGVSGTISNPGYFVDRWKLVGGTVTLTENGITLNGTISQVLPNAIGAIYSASVGMYSGDATVSYNNNSSTGTVTSAGGTIKWVKLEIGEVPTPYVAKGYAQELAECQRYFEALGDIYCVPCYGQSGYIMATNGKFCVRKRVIPTIQFDGKVYDWANVSLLGNASINGINDFGVVSFKTENTVSVGQAYIIKNVFVSADL